MSGGSSRLRLAFERLRQVVEAEIAEHDRHGGHYASRSLCLAVRRFDEEVQAHFGLDEIHRRATIVACLIAEGTQYHEAVSHVRQVCGADYVPILYLKGGCSGLRYAEDVRVEQQCVRRMLGPDNAAWSEAQRQALERWEQELEWIMEEAEPLDPMGCRWLESILETANAYDAVGWPAGRPSFPSNGIREIKGPAAFPLGGEALRSIAAAAARILESAPAEPATEDKPPLSEVAAAVYEMLLSLPDHRGLIGPKIVQGLPDHLRIGESALRGRIIPELKPYGIENVPRKGYRIKASHRPSSGM